MLNLARLKMLGRESELFVPAIKTKRIIPKPILSYLAKSVGNTLVAINRSDRAETIMAVAQAARL